ncbi:MAG TPA: type II/IV secretion system protein, partial [Usitatibacter sp.]|nr:type II/IV secretion system protein [Usitatibacter sp.]
MAAVKPSPGRVDRKLQLGEVLDWLVEDRVVDAAIVSRLQEDARLGRSAARHPLAIIADARIRSISGKPLNAESLTEWLAGRVKLPYYHIDPLKIDLKGVTEVMSAEYAQRRGILPVAVSGREVTIATSEPFI